MRKVLLSILAILLLAGCAMENDVKIYEKYYKAAETHSTQQALSTKYKAEGITKLYSSIRCAEDSATCGALNALASSLGAREIRDIKERSFDAKDPKTSLDVQSDALGTVSAIANPVVTGVVAVKAIEKDKGSVKNSATESATINNSYDEDHATAIGDAPSSTNASPVSTVNGEESSD